ncbi:YozE family protein [Mammaliicoccus sciuri]|uniref:YozE family protein n=1 Tax=Mammaliicoccus sciuri TaxID=1296 RepID=UPI0037C56FA8
MECKHYNLIILQKRWNIEFLRIYSDDDTPLGNLASFVNQEANFPKDEKLYDIILKYFCECHIENCKIE